MLGHWWSRVAHQRLNDKQPTKKWHIPNLDPTFRPRLTTLCCQGLYLDMKCWNLFTKICRLPWRLGGHPGTIQISWFCYTLLFSLGSLFISVISVIILERPDCICHFFQNAQLRMGSIYMAESPENISLKGHAVTLRWISTPWYANSWMAVSNRVYFCRMTLCFTFKIQYYVLKHLKDPYRATTKTWENK